MPGSPAFSDRVTSNAVAADAGRLTRLFGDGDGLLPLWIAEPYVDLPPGVTAALEERAAAGWFGYEMRPRRLFDAFWAWMEDRHGWDGSGMHTSVSPSVGTSMGVVIEELTDPGDGIILQPPVFTDFKPLHALRLGRGKHRRLLGSGPRPDQDLRSGRCL